MYNWGHWFQICGRIWPLRLRDHFFIRPLSSCCFKLMSCPNIIPRRLAVFLPHTYIHVPSVPLCARYLPIPLPLVSTANIKQRNWNFPNLNMVTSLTRTHESSLLFLYPHLRVTELLVVKRLLLGKHFDGWGFICPRCDQIQGIECIQDTYILSPKMICLYWVGPQDLTPETERN